MTRYMPVRAGTYQTSSKFGPRGGGMHWGLDFAAPDGTKIYAAQAGSVVHIGAADGFGQWIVIDHPGEAGSGTTVYGHMWDAHATGLRQGDQVNAGQHIAFVGNNGDSSGPHLHFEVHPSVWQPGTQLDPEAWLAEAVNPAEPPPSDQEPPTPSRPGPLSQEAMLRQIHELLTTPVPSPSPAAAEHRRHGARGLPRTRSAPGLRARHRRRAAVCENQQGSASPPARRVHPVQNR